MVVKIIQESETKNFWTFKELKLENDAKPYDLPKEQLAKAFIKLKIWQEEPCASDFTSKLYSLMAKADAENFRKIFNGFPARATAYSLWFWSTDKNQLNKYFGGTNGFEL